MNKIITCKICGKKLTGRQTLYCSMSCKNKVHQSYPAQKKRGIQRKIEIVEMFGGKCSRCGYKKNMSALSFHHTDPKKKDFKLDVRSLSNRKFAYIQNELKKCILVCNNCHAEIHNPGYEMEGESFSGGSDRT